MNEQQQLFPTERYRMSQLTRPGFWVLSLERAFKTAAQTAVTLIGAESFDVLSFDWPELAAISAGAAVVSLLTSVASAPVGPVKGDPSLV